jgi:hypothetical protein
MCRGMKKEKDDVDERDKSESEKCRKVEDDELREKERCQCM